VRIDAELHRIKVDFSVTKDIKRFVYLYMIVSKDVHVIDTGVAGTEKVIGDYLKSVDRDIHDVKNILLTHSHPDHIGSAHEIKKSSNCTVYASEAERSWIEDVDKQFEERPIPNFHTLLKDSVPVDRILGDDETVVLEEGVTIKAIVTKGHSAGSLSFLWVERGELFTGDSIPVTGDIPIYVSAKDSIETLERLLSLERVERYLPAWDDVYDADTGREKMSEARDHLLLIDETVKSIMENFEEEDEGEIYSRVCDALGLKHLMQNPLFRTSVRANIRENRR
jgi:glyoxylase-like metal-dependent hydrolase (beta-lactamase superfamily II)